MNLVKPAVLVVDDDPRMLTLTQRVLGLEGFKTIPAASGEDALKAFESEKIDMVLLDIMMPGMDGYEVLRRIREFSQLPVVLVTAKDKEDDLVQGLDVGADDYITKPISVRELAARVKAVYRRTSMRDEHVEPAFHLGDLVVDFVAQRVTKQGRELNLTATELKLLCYMAKNAGRLVTPDQILEKVWGREYVGETHLLQVNIARLRKKIEYDRKNPRYIVTRSAIGYMMVKEESPFPTTTFSETHEIIPDQK